MGTGRGPLQWLLQSVFLLLLIAIILNIAVGLIVQVWPWLVSAFIVAGLVWLGLSIWRWRRNQW